MVSYVSHTHDFKPNISAKKCGLQKSFYHTKCSKKTARIILICKKRIGTKFRANHFNRGKFNINTRKASYL